MSAAGPVGMVVGTFTSVSLDPPLVAFMPAKSSTSWPLIRDSGAFCANVLSAEQEELCHSFSRRGGNKFDGIRWTPGGSGSPVLDGVIAWVDCDIDQIVESGDHYIVIGRVRDLDIVQSVTPLAFFRGEFGQVLAPRETKSGELSSHKAEQIAALFADNAPRHQKAKEIAALAGVSPDHYDDMFAPREEIIKEILLEYLNSMLLRYRQAIVGVDDARVGLRRLIDAMFSSVEDHRAATVLFQNERASLANNGDCDITNVEQEMRHLWEDILQKGIKEAAFRANLNPSIVYFMIRDATFVVARWYKMNGAYSVADLSHHYADLILNGVLNDNEIGKEPA
jgi:flavin reductase (DIM6/NTAB) family NADH-FMN oxidoreductase RutF